MIFEFNLSNFFSTNFCTMPGSYALYCWFEDKNYLTQEPFKRLLCEVGIILKREVGYVSLTFLLINLIHMNFSFELSIFLDTSNIFVSI